MPPSASAARSSTRARRRTTKRCSPPTPPSTRPRSQAATVPSCMSPCHTPSTAPRFPAPARNSPGQPAHLQAARAPPAVVACPGMPQAWIGLTLAFVSAIVTNTAYSLEHDAAVALPPLSPRRPFRSAKLLLRDRRWLIAFVAESAGWLMYVAALRLAPLALVQAVTASGLAVLAFATARGHPSRLASRGDSPSSRARGADVAGALAGRSDRIRPAPRGRRHHYLAGRVRRRRGAPDRCPYHLARAASLGLAAGLLFADGDISAKLVGYGGPWLVALLTLIVAYAVGTSVLQSAYQRGDALTAAGLATMVTNAVPIVAGFVLFDETLPHGIRAAQQIAAFTCPRGERRRARASAAPRAKDPVSRRPDRQMPAERPADPR